MTEYFTDSGIMDKMVRRFLIFLQEKEDKQEIEQAIEWIDQYGVEWSDFEKDTEVKE